MIDRTARDNAALLLRRLISGQISNDEFEDRQRSTDDQAVMAFYDMAWLLYSDTHEYKLTGANRLSPSEKREVVRWILFLDSSFEYVWPKIALPGVDPKRRAVGRLWRWISGLHAMSKTEAAAFLATGDYNAWPFVSCGDFKKALRSPRRLSGGVHS